MDGDRDRPEGRLRHASRCEGGEEVGAGAAARVADKHQAAGARSGDGDGGGAAREGRREGDVGDDEDVGCRRPFAAPVLLRLRRLLSLVEEIEDPGADAQVVLLGGSGCLCPPRVSGRKLPR